MRVVHIRKQPNTYIGHSSEGIVVFDDSDMFIASNFSMPEFFTIKDIYRYLNSMKPSYSRVTYIYDTEVVRYTNLLEIPNVDIVTEYHSSSHPELFI